MFTPFTLSVKAESVEFALSRGPPFVISESVSLISNLSPGKIALSAMLGKTISDVFPAAALFANLNLV